MSQFSNPAPKRIGRLHFDSADKLVAQLSFIKKKLRYPVDASKILALFGVLFTLPVPIVLWIFLKRNPEHPLPFWAFLLIAMICIPGVSSLMRFLQTFKFAVVASGFTAADNSKLLIRFFQACQLRYERHPEHPELFWIMSAKIGSDTDTRELVVFIVEDRRILINSHFTRPKFISPVGQPHFKELAKALEKWIDANRPIAAEVVRA